MKTSPPYYPVRKLAAAIASAILALTLALAWHPTTTDAQTWQDITANAGSATLGTQRGAIASDGTRLYAIGGPTGSGVLVSTDFGATFTPVNAVSGAGYTLSDINGLHTLRFANNRLWLTGTDSNAAVNYLHWLTPGGTTWNQGSTSGFPPPASLNTFGTLTDIVYDEVSTRYFAIAEIGGVWSSADGATWEPRTEGFGGIGAPASLATVDGTLFALRPLSGLRRSTDAGLSWLANSPHTGVDSGQLRRTGDTISFVVPGLSATSIAYVSADAGETWTTVPGLPPGMSGNLSGDGQFLYTRTQTGRLLFSATAGLNWQDLPVDGVQLNYPVWPVTDSTGVFVPTRIERQGDYLFMIGNEILDASFTTAPRLYRIHLPGFDWRPETTIITQPRVTRRMAGESATLSVLAAGENLSYEWFKNGEPVPNSDSATLHFPAVTVENAGDYSVVVTGDRGVVPSAVATLEVRVERIDGQLYLSYEGEESSGGFLYRLADGTLLRGYDSGPISLARLDLAGKRLAFRNLSTGLPNAQQFVPQHHALDSAGRFIAAGYINGSNTAGNQRIRRYDPVTLADDPTFAVVSGFDSAITGLVELPGRGYLVIGNFNAIGGVPVSRVVLIDYNGTVDPTFAAGLGLSPIGLVVGRDGTTYIRGSFGNSPTHRLVRLDRFGRRMLDFPQFTSDLEAMFRLRDGRIAFTTVFSGIRTLRVILPDGTDDPAFTPVGTLNGRVNALVEQPDGKLILAGDFTTIGSNSVARHVRLLPTGGLDATYDASAGFSTGDIRHALYVPGYVFFSNSAAAPTFQGYPGFGRGPLPVFAQAPALAILRQSDPRPVVQGSSVTLSVEAVGATALSYAWYLGDDLVPGANGPTLTLANFNLAQAGTYTVRITRAGSTDEVISQPIVLTLLGAPEIASAPLGADLLTGAAHTFSVLVDGAGPFSYEWRRNGVPVPGAASSSTLALTDLQPAQAGTYTVVVSNTFGSIESAPVALAVNTVIGVRLTTFTPNPNSAVSQILRRPDGVLVVRGTFTTIGGASANRFAFLNPDTGAQTPSINLGGFNNTVNGLAVQSTGKVIVGGQFTNALSTTRNRLVRLKLDGTVDDTFNAGGADPTNTVLGVWVLSDDSILVNSSGGTYRGTAVGPLYRLFPDGTLDTAWNTAVGIGPTSANNIYSIAEQPDGRLVIGGAFGGFSGAPGTSHLVRLLPNGSLDTAFTQTRPMPNYYVNALAVQPDGKILVGGEFNNLGTATPAYRKLARLHPDGALDTTFPANTTTNTGQHVFALQLLPGGKILLGGSFTSWPGTNSTHAGGRTVLLNPDGSVDPFYRPGPFDSNVSALLALPEGRFYAGGSFTSPGSRLARFSLEPTVLAITRQPRSVVADLGGTAGFDVGIYTPDTATYQWFKNGVEIPGATSATLALTDLTRDSAGAYSVGVTNPAAEVTVFSAAVGLTILAEPIIVTSPVSSIVAPGGSAQFSVSAIGAGELTYQWRRNGTNIPGATSATLDLTGITNAEAGLYDVLVGNTIDTVPSAAASLSVAAVVGGIDLSFNIGTGPDGNIHAITVLSSGRIAVGGNFFNFNGVSRPRFALLEADGTPVTLPTNPSFTGQVNTIVEQPDGKLLVGWGIVGGSLSQVGFRRINADGTNDNTFATGFFMANTIRIDATHVYVAGYVSNSESGLRRYNITNGVEDTAFTANTAAAGFQSRIAYGLHLQPDGKIIATHNFGAVIRLMPNGTVDPSFTGTGGSNPRALRVMPDGKIWIAGDFTAINGDTTRRFVARLNADGTLDTSVPASGLTGSGNGYGLTSIGNDVYLAGSFTYTAGGQTWRSLAKVSGSTGTVDNAFGPILSTNDGFAIAADAQQRLLLGGSFTTPANRLMRVSTTFDGETAIVGQPRSQTVAPGARAVFNVAWVGAGSASYAWFKGADAVPVATTADLVIDSATEANAGSYRVVVTVGGQTLESDSATLTIGAGIVPGLFADWPALLDLPADQRGPNATPAGDNVPNLVKYAIGIGPLDSAAGRIPQEVLESTVDDETYPVVCFVRDTTVTGVALHVGVATRLDFTVDLGTTVVSTEDLGGGLERVCVRSHARFSDHARQFFRLGASEQP